MSVSPIVAEPTFEPVRAAFAWPTNAAMIADVAKLYLDRSMVGLDPTFGSAGGWWKRWRPETLITHSNVDDPTFDFRSLPYRANQFDFGVLDGPYKLNGRDTDGSGIRYGVHVRASVEERHQAIKDGMVELCRVVKPKTRKQAGGLVLVKCMAQVCNGKIWWQDRIFADHGEDIGLELVDRFDMLGGGRDQPERFRFFCQACDARLSVPRGTSEPRDCKLHPSAEKRRERSRQEHGYFRPSTLLLFRRGAMRFELPKGPRITTVKGETYQQAFGGES